MRKYTDFDRLYSDSYLRINTVVKQGKDFFERFYDNFIASSSQVAEKFKNTDMKIQKKMLRDSLTYLERFSVYKREDDFMLALAQRHNKAHADVPPNLYDLWLAALIETVKEYDPEYDDKVEIAWRMQLAAGIEYMKFQYSK